MSKVKQLVLDFLNEIKDLSNLNKGESFIINVEEDKTNKIDFKSAVIEDLKQSGAIKILDSFSGIIGISGNEIEKWNLKANSYKIIVNSNKFDIFYKEKELELREKLRCSYENKNCTLYVNDQKITFSKNTGLILFFIYKSRIFTEDKSYQDYNIFIEETDYNNDYRNITSDKFNRSVKEINERVQKETNGYIKELIAIKSLGKNKRNEYRWVAKI